MRWRDTNTTLVRPVVPILIICGAADGGEVLQIIASLNMNGALRKNRPVARA